MKIERNLSGIYFRQKNEATGKYENIVFEDLEESDQDRVISGKSAEWLISLAKGLAKTINNIGGQLDLQR